MRGWVTKEPRTAWHGSTRLKILADFLEVERLRDYAKAHLDGVIALLQSGGAPAIKQFEKQMTRIENLLFPWKFFEDMGRPRNEDGTPQVDPEVQNSREALASKFLELEKAGLIK